MIIEKIIAAAATFITGGKPDFSADMESFGMAATASEFGSAEEAENENIRRFVKLTELHHIAFTCTPEEPVWVKLEEMYATEPWLYNKGSAYVLGSLKLVQDRAITNWEYIFSIDTNLSRAFEEGSQGDEIEAKKYQKRVQTHLSEEASEVIKEVCKNDRNRRLFSTNLLKEMADMQAMIELSKRFMSQAQLDELALRTSMMIGKKRVVIAAEVAEFDAEA